MVQEDSIRMHCALKIQGGLDNLTASDFGLTKSKWSVSLGFVAS